MELALGRIAAVTSVTGDVVMCLLIAWRGTFSRLRGDLIRYDLVY
jgi:hypothetical protein